MDKKQALYEYCLRLGDSSLVIGHRMSEWCGHGPILEEDIAMTNIALDLVGQARTLLQYAAQLKGGEATEDSLAYHRNPEEFRNLLLCEHPNGDFGDTMARHFYFDVYHELLLTELKNSTDETLSAYAEKSLKEVTYHQGHTSDWIIRLGDGTEESHERIQNSINKLWGYTGELFAVDEVDEVAVKEGFGVNLTPLNAKWEVQVKAVLTEATLKVPASNRNEHTGGKQGRHSQELAEMLEEMQVVPRTYPDAVW